MRRLGEKIFRFDREQKGFTLLETLVSVAIFAAIGVVLMNGLFTGYRSLGTSEDSTFIESLAKSQVEYIKNQSYISVANYAIDGPYDVIAIPAELASKGFTVEINTPETAQPAGESGFELQSITIEVKRHGNVKLVIIFYRTGLAL
ncbi:type II secretion system protein [Chloroflexota bacterium]